MRESTSKRAIEMPANTIILTRAEAPCLKSGGGLYSMTSNNQAQCANVRTPVKCRGQTKKGRINLSGPYVRLLVGEDRAELVHALQRHAGTTHHAGERVFGDQHRQAGFFHQQTVQVAQQRATTGQHHAFFGDVGAQFRRRLFQRIFHGRDDVVQRVGQRFEDLVAGNGERTRYAFGQIAALDFHFLYFRTREGRTDGFLDRFRRLLADQHAVVATDVIDDGFVELVAANAHRTLVHHAAQRNDADFGGAAADVDHDRAGRSRHRQTGADCCSHGFFDQVDLRSTGAQRRFTDRTARHLSRAARNADDDARGRTEQLGVVHHADELLQHLLGDGKVGNHAVFHRANRLDIARNLAQHLFCFLADCLNGLFAIRAALLADRHDRRLVKDNTLTTYINQSVCRSKVNSEVVREVTT